MLINWEAAVLLGQQDGRLPEFEGRILEKGHLIGGRTIGKMGVDLLTYKNRTWSKILAKVFKIEVMVCPDCGDAMRALCSIKDPFSIRRYLKHLNIAYEPPPRAPPRYSQESFDFEQPQADEREPVMHLD